MDKEYINSPQWLHLDLDFEWNFANDLLKYGDQSVNELSLPQISSSSCYAYAYKEFLCKNLPFIVRGGVIDNWRLKSEWVNDDSDFNIEEIAAKYGHIQAPVSRCDEYHMDTHTKTIMTLADYLTYLKQPVKKESLYLKDWHLHRELRNIIDERGAHSSIYRTPSFFASDWLNEFLESADDTQSRDDYRFVYLGDSSTWTPLHADVFRSFSWSANLCGRKRWVLLAPGAETRLLDGRLPDDICRSPPQDTHNHRSPLGGVQCVTKICRTGEIRYLDVEQRAGDVLFVPSGWHHQVWNIGGGTATLSLNHNWLNAANAWRVCGHVVDSLAHVQAELTDLRPATAAALSALLQWHEQCDSLLHALVGMGLRQLLDLLVFTTHSRLECLTQGRPCAALDGHVYSTGHVVSDLRCLRALSGQLEQCEQLSEVTCYRVRLRHLQDLVDKIEAVLACVDRRAVV